MEIKLHEIPIRELIKDYADNGEGGVVGYGGRLDIRPIYQREFIYKDKQRDAVIDTVRKKFPLNVLYWAVNDGGKFEVLDGQQRIISICQYCTSVFSIDYKYFHNLTQEEKDAILDYELMVYHCKGNDREKLDWFKTINIAGEKLTDQELRNAVYAGTWVSDAKGDFSRRECRAYGLASKYVKGSPIRQEFLETAIEWIIAGKHNKDKKPMQIEDYMAEHQHDKNASPLWQHFQQVIAWVQATFPNYRNEMRGVPWGELHAKYKNASLNADELEIEVTLLMEDDEVKNKAGIYQYVLTRDEKHLNLRAFTPSQKRQVLEKQNGKCKNPQNNPNCKGTISLDEAEADHIDPWSEGGKTELDNCQVLCKPCNRRKSDS
ncbi:MAG: DUF262 domain-containing protein [Proteobacteria bacterium]|nr:DUF262 domain-containing protein [Pseudomonadota bacterium]